MSKYLLYSDGLRTSAFHEITVATHYLKIAKSVQETSFNPDGFYDRALLYVRRANAYWKASVDWKKAHEANDYEEKLRIRSALISSLGRITLDD